MKRILYIIYIMVATLAVMLFGGCEEQVFEYDFINNVGEEPTPTPTPTPGVNAKNVIYYTSTDGKVITPKKDAFGVSIVSNTYTNGKGTITFSGTVTKIGEGTFYNCSTLASITIPNSVTSIGNDAFCDCTSLKSVTIPNSVTSIGYDAFAGCSALTSATIPNSVTSIGSLAFGNCTSLKSVTIPNSVTEIGDGAFRGCTSLKSIYGKFASEDNRCLIVDGVLNSFAPAGLTSYIIPNSVTSIGDWVFFGCTSLTSVTIPNSVTSIGSLTFSYCSKLAEVYCKPTTPPTLGGPTVFDGNASDRKIYVPSASVNAYKTATNWSRYADQIVADGSSTTEYIIEYTSSDGNIVTPYGTPVFGANIVSNVYENGKGIITFDGPVTTIGARAFYKRSTLASITIPESVTEIGSSAFWNCTSLTSITIPNNVTSIGNYAFLGCSGLTKVTIGNSVTSIGYCAFYGCTSLTSVTIPNSVTEIGEASFSSCTSLKSFYGKFASEDNRCLIVNGKLKSFAPAGLTTYSIPASVTSIGENAFYGCKSLTNIVIPDKVTSIGDYAFGDCTSLTSVTIPNSVTEIGNYAFYSCSKLAEVYCKPTTPPTLRNSYVFDGGPTDRKIYVPSASVDAYKTATNWSVYADQIVAEGSTTTEYVIEYTSTDGAIVTPNTNADFGANIVSNVYENGKGVITFDGPVTKIGRTTNIVNDSAFYNCRKLLSITIPNSVTSIGDHAFYGCTSLSSITIPNSVTSIDGGVFGGCTSLKSIYGKFASEDNRCLIVNGALQAFAPAGLTSYIIPNNVTSIGDWAFDNCTSLTSVTIPDSVTSIGYGAFRNCTSLTSVTIPNSVTLIRYEAFYGCSALTSVTIPNSVTSIGGSAFYKCTSLERVTIPNSVTSIGYETFYGCTSLSSVTIPNSVTSIGIRAFRNCTSLTSVTIPNSVTEIGDSAFYFCSKLAEVYCKPTTPPTLGGTYVFDYGPTDRKIYVPSASVNAYKTATNWSEYASQIVAEGSSTTEYVIEYTSSDGNIVTPYSTSVFGSNIVSNVYENGKGKITFDGPVTTIGAQAFYNCSTLASITIPNSVTSIGNYTFYNCSALTSVTIPNSVTSIGNYAFDRCKSLTSVTIPDSVTSIGNALFSVCTSLKSIYGKFASEDNRCLIVNGVLNSFAPAGLTTYSIPNSVTSIGDYVVCHCSSLTSVTIPNSVTLIGDQAFYGCTSLTSVTIPNSVTSIGHTAFFNCTKLTSVTIPNSVTEIGEASFCFCTSLKSFYGKFASEDNRCLIVNGVLISSAPAGLTTYSIPNSVTSIGSYAFEFCTSLTSVTIPDSVTSIGNYAFYSCSKLAEVYCKPTTPPTLGEYSVFGSNATGRKIYVPSASVNAYKTATNWSEYASQIVAE